jgi:hypothetical protein
MTILKRNLVFCNNKFCEFIPAANNHAVCKSQAEEGRTNYQRFMSNCKHGVIDCFLGFKKKWLSLVNFAKSNACPAAGQGQKMIGRK